MGVPRWFELTLTEAEDADKAVDYSHLGRQLGLRVEEVIPRVSMSGWWELAGQWNDDSKLQQGELSDMDRRVLAFLEEACPECLVRIPEAKRPELLRGLFEKRR